MAQEQAEREHNSPKPVRLDGRTLEGGGQLVRIAIALSALTGRPIAIDNIRGNRSGKKGLKGSHLAAITSLAEMSGSTVAGAQVGASSLGFYPPPREEPTSSPSPDQQKSLSIKPEISIKLPTAGAVFLVFQALYPYLLHCGGGLEQPLRLSIIGGTNVSFAPSYDYISQVLIPNFAQLGLPRLSVQLDKRGWASGPVSLGKVTFLVETLKRDERPGYQFPLIDLSQYRRGTISRIDVTVLAPDDPLLEVSDRGSARHAKSSKTLRRAGSKRQTYHHTLEDEENSLSIDTQSEIPATIREFIEGEIHRSLRKQLKKLPTSIFTAQELDPRATTDADVVPVAVHTSEATHHRSCLYVLVVAHTSTGFKIGHDFLYGAQRERQSTGGPKGKDRGDMVTVLRSLIKKCVDGFVQELCNPHLQDPMSGTARHQPCVDEFMRDQLVVFEALGRASGHHRVKRTAESEEDERYWSLHTKTAQWVCREMLGEDCLG